MSLSKSPATPRLLVLSGAHSGAELNLSDGAYAIGSSDSDDIVLNDREIAPGHVRIDVVGGAARLCCRDHAVHLDGKRVRVPAQPLAMGRIFSVGDTHMVLADEAFDSDRINLPVLHRGDDRAASPRVAQAIWQQRFEPTWLKLSAWWLALPSAGAVDDTLRGVRADWLPQLKASSINARQLLLSVRHGSLKSRSLIAGGTVLIAVSGLVGLSHVQARPESTVEQARHELLALAASGAGANNAGQIPLHVCELDNGAVEVNGFVASTDELMQLREKVDPHGRDIRIKVLAREQVLEVAQTVLREFSLDDIELRDASPGVLEASGYVSSASRWRTARETLVADHPGIERIVDDAVQSQEQRVDQLAAALAQAKLDSLVTLTAGRNSVSASGSLAPAEMARWQRVSREFRERHGDQPELRTGVTVKVAPPVASRDSGLAISAIVLSSTRRYLVTASGRRYHEGEQLPDGFTVRRIEPRHAVLSYDQQELTRPLGEGIERSASPERDTGDPNE